MLFFFNALTIFVIVILLVISPLLLVFFGFIHIIFKYFHCGLTDSFPLPLSFSNTFAPINVDFRFFEKVFFLKILLYSLQPRFKFTKMCFLRYHVTLSSRINIVTSVCWSTFLYSCKGVSDVIFFWLMF